MLFAITKILIYFLSIPSMMILATDYCKLCKKGSHTLCRYTEGPAGRCIDYKKPEFTSSVRKYIIDVHNDIRNHVASGQELKGAMGKQPPASNMNSLQWDNELAEIAQRWADQCIDLNSGIQHDECRKTERFEVGQNVLSAVTPSMAIPEISILVLNWYKQVQNVLPSDIENFSGIQRGKFLIGQYTQLVWAETRYFGCGMSTFKNPNSSSESERYLHRLVCNYGPRGNLIGASVYEKGISCSKCPFGKCDSIRTSLCEGIEEPNKVYDKILPSTYSEYHVDIPTYLFTSMSLGYILKHNLTDFVQNLLQNINIHYESDNSTKRHNQSIKCTLENSTESFGLDEILTLLSTTKSRTKGQSYSKPIEKGWSLEKDLKKMSNLLSRHDPDNQRFDVETKLYELENGEIIVDDCKHYPQLCQYEVSDDESAHPKISESEEIILPNNMVYKTFKGTWFQGRCRCNYVYRSSAASITNSFLWKFVLTLFIIFK